MFKRRGTGLTKGIWLNKVNGCIPEKVWSSTNANNHATICDIWFGMQSSHRRFCLKKPIDFPMYENAKYGCKVLLGEKY